MAMSLLKDVESRQQRKDLPKFNVGDTVRVFSRIKEGEKERVQYFEGIVIGFHRNAVSTTFKVRKESYGVGVERTYPIHSPLLEKIEVKKRGDVRRAKLFYLREVSGKKARIREKKDWLSKKGIVVPSEGVAGRSGRFRGSAVRTRGDPQGVAPYRSKASRRSSAAAGIRPRRASTRPAGAPSPDRWSPPPSSFPRDIPTRGSATPRSFPPVSASVSTR